MAGTYTEAQKRAAIKHIKEKTDDIRLRTKKGLKDRYKHAAAEYSSKIGKKISMTQFIIEAVEEKINRDDLDKNITQDK